MFFDQTLPEVNSLDFRGHQMENYRFSRRWFFIDNFFDIRDTKIKMTASCLARRAGSKEVLLTLKDKFQNLTSGQVRQVNVRSVSGQCKVKVRS